jgi:hypothetical protein
MAFNGNVNFPKLTGSGTIYDWWYGSPNLPKLQGVGTINVVPSWAGTASLPHLGGAGQFTPAPLWDGVGMLPGLTAAGEFIPSPAFDGQGTLPAFTTAGGFFLALGFDGAALLPSLRGSGTFLPASLFDGRVTLHLTATGDFLAPIAFNGRVSLPALTAEGIILVPQVAATLFNALVMNARTAGVALYTNYPFTSLFKLGLDYYGIRAGGLVRLGGTTDDGAPIAAEARSGVSDFGDKNLKYFPEARLTVRTEGAMEFGLVVDETREYLYPVEYREGKQGMHVKRVNGRKGLAKGVKGNVAQIVVRNVDGADFDMQTVEMDVLKTNRS